MKTNCKEVIPSLFSIRFNPRRLTFATDWHGHLNTAAWIIELQRPKKIVELGVFRADSLATIAQACDELHHGAAIFGVDTWQGDSTTGEYSDELFDEVRDYFLFNHPRVVLSKMTFHDALREHDAGDVDLLHIDGCHSYEAVKADFESWLPTVSDVGIVMLHDICVSNSDFGTGKFWNEVKSDYPNFSFLHSSGLGVLAVGTRVPDHILHLTECGDCLQYARAVFETIGVGHIFNDKYRWTLHEFDNLKQTLLTPTAEEKIKFSLGSLSSFRFPKL